MPRQARQQCETGYFHLIVRGIGRQALFESREDYLFFLSILERFSRQTAVVICAYCLMENHVHLLIRDSQDQKALMMKKIGVSYAQYYNRKYDRQGHLFQDRYLSEAVADERYLLTVFRYILNNPQRAGICPAARYEWSSYRLYGRRSGFVDTDLLCALIGDARHYAEFIAAPDGKRCLDCDEPRDRDEWARTVLRECLGAESGAALQSLDREARNAALRRLLGAGLSIRQIERLTGISRGVIQRIKR